jgi:hypothetical protein
MVIGVANQTISLRGNLPSVISKAFLLVASIKKRLWSFDRNLFLILYHFIKERKPMLSPCMLSAELSSSFPLRLIVL